MAGRFSRRMRRGVTGTAVAVAAMAALSASQAPGIATSVTGDSGGDHSAPPPGPAISGDSPYYTQMPPLNTAPSGSAPTSTSPGTSGPSGSGDIPATVLDAYRKAESAIGRSDPGCHLPWQLLAAIGQVESNQARGGNVDADGTTVTPILGPELDGNGFAEITDTDNGVYDGDYVHDRAVGPMQFIPSTWKTWGADGNGDGRADPNNVYDAALAAGHYLCADGRNLAESSDMDSAILGYNHSEDYLSTVLSWYRFFRTGHHEVPDHPGGSSTPPPSTASPSPSHSSSPHPSTSAHPTVSATGSVKPTPTKSSKPTPTGSASPSPSCSATPTSSASPSGSKSSSPAAGDSAKAGSSSSASPSPTGSDDPCASSSPSAGTIPSPQP